MSKKNQQEREQEVLDLLEQEQKDAGSESQADTSGETGEADVPELVLGENPDTSITDEEGRVKPALVNPIASKQQTGVITPPKKSVAHAVSDVVYIKRRVRQETSYRYGENINAADVQGDELKYIGSSFNGKGKDTLRGLDTDEEKVYLPQIIGISETSPDWDKMTKDFWINIRKPVPAGAGLELQIGFNYPSKEIAIKAEAHYEQTKNIRTRSRYGSPINVEDYILYRYCLKYGRVANTIEELFKSEKIEFYIYSKSKAISDQHKALLVKDNAYTCYLQVLGDAEKAKAILVRFAEPVHNLADSELRIKLKEMADTKPRLFKEYFDDPETVLKALIEECVIHQKLVRTANTDMIHLNNRLLGNNIDEVIKALKSPEHSKDLLALKAQLAYANRKRLSDNDDEDEINEDY